MRHGEYTTLLHNRLDANGFLINITVAVFLEGAIEIFGMDSNQKHRNFRSEVMFYAL